MIPTTYAEWVVVLDRFGDGDDTVLAVMVQGTLDWTNVVAERWTRHVSTCLTGRLQGLSRQLQTGLDRAHGDHLAISNAMLIARRGLVPLRAFVQLPVLHDDVRLHLTSEVDRWARETQASLERHATGLRHDQGRLLKTIRDHDLTVVVAAAIVAPSPETPPGAEPSPTRGRRVLL